MSDRARIPVLAIAALLIAATGVGISCRRSSTSPDAAASPAPVAAYRCPMHPAMTSDHPADCPICGMRMVPFTPRSEQHAERQEPALGGVPERVAVRMPEHKLALAGVGTSPVIRAPFVQRIRAVGRVTYDETREKHVTARAAGYVEMLHANAIGEHFRKGQPLLEIFSPELLASQQEYVLALEARARTAGSSLPSIAGTGDELVRSAQRRLELFGVSEDAIRKLEATRQPQRTITIYAAVDGYLTHRAVTEGDRVDLGAHLLDLTDLSRVWVVASVFEHELPFVRVGQRATMTLAYVPGKTLEGRVTLVYPALDPATRTAQVRLEFQNPGLDLKPDMFAEVVLEASLGERLSVPASAVLETGARSVVFVESEAGLFEPRAVTIGLRLPNRAEVLSGLAEGDHVVTSGNFLLDSESRLGAALEGHGP